MTFVQILSEINGGLADIASILPLITSPLFHNVSSPILFWNGIQCILLASIYNYPICVQPMSAISALALTHNYSMEEVWCAGLFVSICVFLLSQFVSLHKLVSTIPSSLLNGLVAGIGLSIVIKGYALVKGDATITHVTLTILTSCLLSLRFISVCKTWPILTVIVIVTTSIFCSWNASSPVSTLFVSDGHTWGEGILHMGLSQLPLTLLNSVVVTSEVTNISAGKLGTSILAQNIACMSLGSFPSCHGASGILWQQTCGAMTKWSVIVGGVIKCLVACLVSFSNFPIAVTGVMFMFTGLEMVNKGSFPTPQKDLVRVTMDDVLVYHVTMVSVGVANAWIGLMVGIIVHFLTHGEIVLHGMERSNQLGTLREMDENDNHHTHHTIEM